MRHQAKKSINDKDFLQATFFFFLITKYIHRLLRRYNASNVLVNFGFLSLIKKSLRRFSPAQLYQSVVNYTEIPCVLIEEKPIHRFVCQNIDKGFMQARISLA